MSWPRVLSAIGFLSCALAFAGDARAFTFSDLSGTAGNPAGPLVAVGVDAGDLGASFDVHWSVADPALSASATFTVAGFSDDAVLLDITLDHTTNLADAGLTNAAILSMGFGVSPDVVASLSDAGSVFDMVGDGSGPQQTFPGGFKQIDVCIFAQGCSGGAIHHGLAAGASDSFRVALAALDGGFGDGLTLAFFPIKFQSSAGSFEPPGSFEPAIPEPTSMLLYAGGLVVVATGTHLRRRR